MGFLASPLAASAGFLASALDGFLTSAGFLAANDDVRGFLSTVGLVDAVTAGFGFAAKMNN